MAARRIEERLEQLAALRTRPVAEAAPLLRRALGDRSNVVVAKAAQIAGELAATDAIPELLAAFARLFEDPAKRDPQCWGKNAIANALRRLDYRQGAPFLRGARWVQMEPVWGGQADTATTLRGTCLLALPACSDVPRPAVLRCLVDALVEPEAPVREDAARAIGAMGGDEAALVLRLKARVGDSAPPVLGQVFESLLALEPHHGLEFLGGFLAPAGGEAAEEAALALGASRTGRGVEALIAAWQEARGESYRATLLRALAISRREEALDFLRRLAELGRAADRAAALAALELFYSTATPG